MDAQISLNTLIQMGAIIVGIWGFSKVIMEIVKNITARHDREQSWDKAVEDIAKEREQITAQFNERLDEMNEMLESNHVETESKIQELTSIVIMLTKSVKAILDGQVEQGLNGSVRKQRDEVDCFLTELIGK